MSTPMWRSLHHSIPWSDLHGGFGPADDLLTDLPSLADPKICERALDALWDLVGYGLPDAVAPTIDVVSALVAAEDAVDPAAILTWLGVIGEEILHADHGETSLSAAITVFHRATKRLAWLADDAHIGPWRAAIEAIDVLLPGVDDGALDACLLRLRQRYQRRLWDPHSAAYLGALELLGWHPSTTAEAPVEHRIIAGLLRRDPEIEELLVDSWDRAQAISSFLPILSDDLTSYLKTDHPELAARVLQRLPNPTFSDAEALVELAEQSRRHGDAAAEVVLRLEVPLVQRVRLLSRLERSARVLDSLHDAAQKAVESPGLSDADAEICTSAAHAMLQAGDPRWLSHLLFPHENWVDCLVRVEPNSSQVLVGALKDVFPYHLELAERLAQMLPDPAYRDLKLRAICSWPAADAAWLLPRVRGIADSALGAVTVAHLTGEVEDWRVALTHEGIADVIETVVETCTLPELLEYRDLCRHVLDSCRVRASLLPPLIQHAQLPPNQAWPRLAALLADADPPTPELMGLALTWADQGLADSAQVYRLLHGFLDGDGQRALGAVLAMLRHGDEAPLSTQDLIELFDKHLRRWYTRDQVINCVELLLARPGGQQIRVWLRSYLDADSRFASRGHPIPDDIATCRRIDLLTQ